MSRGEELALAALKKEHKVLSRRADKAKAEADKSINIGSELAAIRQEFQEIVDSGDHGKEVLQRLKELKNRRDKAHRVLKVDCSKLFDRQIQAEMDRDALGEQVSKLELRMSLHGGRAAQ